jgi:adenylate cyclase
MSSMSDTKARASLGRLFRGFGLGLLVAIIGLVVTSLPFARGWEEDLGLTWLFRLRGPITPPNKVTIVSMDSESSERLRLPDNPRKWPRDIHGRLLERLTELGASVVVFDVMFQDPRDPAGDREFAESVRRAGNVILFELLQKKIIPLAEGNTDGNEVVTEQRIPPIPELAHAAMGLAPFVLPRVPRKIGAVWIFKPEAGEAATLPMVALQAQDRESFDRILALIANTDPTSYGRRIRAVASSASSARIDQRVEMLRQIFLEDTSLAARLSEHLNGDAQDVISPDKHLSALIAALSGPGSIYLNFYGPPRTLATISYHQALMGEPRGDPDLLGHTVFVGAAPRLQPQQRDGFFTPYSSGTGLDIGGVEIAATAFANLLDRDPVLPLAPAREALLVLVWGLALGMGLRRLGGGWILLAAAGAGGAYLQVAYLLFARTNLWLPLVTPLLAQLLPAAFGAILLRYRDLRQERENIRRAFGMHLPLPVVDQLARGIDDLKASAKQAYGICLATDAEQYTALSERLEPVLLKQFMNSYYEALFPPVRSRGGVIADVVGDAMLAIWAADGNRPELRKAACDAAIEILSAVDDFNHSAPDHRLPIRLGLHCGELVLGHVGAADHYEYRAVGDIVNTTSRIEELCKKLGTRLLVSDQMVTNLEGLHVRPLGRFLLKGKTRPLGITELIPPDDGQEDGLCERFSVGLEAFRKGDFSLALKCFEAIEEEISRDGPSSFYRDLCLRYLLDPPQGEWAGVARMTGN